MHKHFEITILEPTVTPQNSFAKVMGDGDNKNKPLNMMYHAPKIFKKTL